MIKPSLCSCLALSILAAPAAADPAPAEAGRPGMEVNVLWPFFPGGMFDARVLLPGVTAGGLVVVGARSDYNQSLRSDEGQAFELYAQLGYRQFVWRGLHAELITETGLDHLAHGVGAMSAHTANALAFVVWGFAGYQQPLTDRFYVNVRAGAGYMAYHSDPWPGIVRGPVPAADVNLGVEF
jgi:hypothetical protein